MSNPIFITFKDTLINVEDISWAGVSSERTFYDDDKPWSMTINYRGVGKFTVFNFETQIEAQNSYQYFKQLVTDALMETSR